MFLNDKEIQDLKDLLSQANCSVQPPAPFDFHPKGLIKKWKKWKKKFLRYLNALEESLLNVPSHKGSTNSFRVSVLMYLLGENSEEIFKWLEWRGWTTYQTLQQTMHRMNTHFIRMVYTQNNVYVRLNFHRRFQLVGESITEYIKAIKFLAHLCSFGKSYDMMMRDKVVVGILSDSTREKMFAFDDMLTFEKACMIAFNDELRTARRPG